jgi:hypothetical protein
VSSLEVLPVSKAGQKAWLQAKHAAHAGDPVFVAPLNLFETRRISPKHSPFFEDGEAVFFVAMRNGRAVGRISAQINRRDPGYRDAKIGQFGFFDVIDDADAAVALLAAARNWLSTQGCSAMRGPFNLSINEECGCQIEGFETAPSYLMPQARPWTSAFLEAAGFVKAVDMYAYRSTPDAIKAGLEHISKLSEDFRSITVRPVRMSDFNAEVHLLADIFNDAWSDNWGFVPFSPGEIDLLAAELKLIYRSNYGYFAEIDGEPVGVLIGVPNVNAIIAGMNGRLTPLGLMRMAWSLHREKVQSTRIPIAGIRKRWQSGFSSVAIVSAMVRAALLEADRRSVDWFEFSWILEQNKSALKLIKQMGATRVSTYRIYEKSFAGTASFQSANDRVV